ncbi:MAG: ABC transporter [Magnetococcales bacterium]|nr:ABC transporter [Magnetococcales bacterium]PPR11956.1 MAG: Daunorubicin/doxorubicin resistance ATP-binding protein DrrA [Pseudomonadota bacterium]
MAVIEAQNIQKSFGEFKAVKGVDFQVPEGTCVGLLGPNGAGKTTTMRMIMGLSALTAGSLKVFGVPVDKVGRSEKMRIGLVPQEDNLDPDLSVRQNLEIYGSYFGLEKSYIKERADSLLDFMQLSEKEDNRVNHLSGGMKRRLIIARALIADPEFVILDEPTTGLDPQARVLIWKSLLKLKEQGKTLLLTTHYMDEAQRLCDNIVIVDGGKVLDEGSPKELISKHVKNNVFEVQKPIPADLEKSDIDHEDIGDSVLYYVNDPEKVQGLLGKNATYMQRVSNLEDVFLRLTGHKLRE